MRDEQGRLIYKSRSNCEAELMETWDSPPAWSGVLKPRLNHGYGPHQIVGGRVPVLGSHEANNPTH